MSKSWNINCEEMDSELHFTIRWSPWGLMDKWVIIRRVPSEAGLFQIWVKKQSGLVLAASEWAYFGGLRNTLREIIDEMAPSGERLRAIIRNENAWFRFSTSSSKEHLILLQHCFKDKDNAFDDEGRSILIKEVDDYRKYTLPPSDIHMADRSRLQDADFGPPMPKAYRRYKGLPSIE